MGHAPSHPHPGTKKPSPVHTSPIQSPPITIHHPLTSRTCTHVTPSCDNVWSMTRIPTTIPSSSHTPHPFLHHPNNSTPCHLPLTTLTKELSTTPHSLRATFKPTTSRDHKPSTLLRPYIIMPTSCTLLNLPLINPSPHHHLYSLMCYSFVLIIYHLIVYSLTL